MSDTRTKAELEAENAELKRRLSSTTKDNEGGWIVTTPNPKFSGKSYGIQFVNGRAFISKARKDGRYKMGRLVKDLKYSAREVTAEEMTRLMAEASQADTVGMGIAEAISSPQVIGG